MMEVSLIFASMSFVPRTRTLTVGGAIRALRPGARFRVRTATAESCRSSGAGKIATDTTAVFALLTRTPSSVGVRVIPRIVAIGLLAAATFSTGLVVGSPVGETTFGTGTVLSEYPLSDGSSILLGTAEWLTPNGDTIRGSGIEPDVEIELDEDQDPRTPNETKDLTREEIFEEDAQLERAFELLQEE